jgi:hypothetical protein
VDAAQDATGRRHDDETRLMPLVLVAVSLILWSGCAKPDWIQQTLVTVDVTGSWFGSCSARTGSIPNIQMKLTQSGSKVTGQSLTSSPTFGGMWGLEGTINGDVFRFQTQSGLGGEFQVNEDEMSGLVSGTAGPLNCQLRRHSPASHRP